MSYFSAILRTISGYLRAIQPIMKKVARVSVSSNPEYAVHVSMNTHRVMFPLFGRVCGRVVEQVEPLLDIKSKNVHRIGLMGWTIRQITGDQRIADGTHDIVHLYV